MVRFDHDFIGREALEALDKPSQRRKVTLAWNGEDAGQDRRLAVHRRDPVQGPRRADLELCRVELRRVLLNGKVVGLSLFSGYSHNERKELSLAVIDPDIEVGTEVTLVWGEPDGGSLKASVERPHSQMEVRATVAPVPYSQEAREHYHEGWRSHQA